MFRANDGSSSLGGADEITDLDFFNTFSIPLVRQAVESFMEMEVVEISTQHLFYTVSSQTEKRKDQIEFTEVRLCRLLHYFLDRPEIGIPIVNETLLMFLEYACKRDPELLKELQVVSFLCIIVRHCVQTIKEKEEIKETHDFIFLSLPLLIENI